VLERRTSEWEAAIAEQQATRQAAVQLRSAALTYADERAALQARLSAPLEASELRVHPRPWPSTCCCQAQSVCLQERRLEALFDEACRSRAEAGQLRAVAHAAEAAAASHRRRAESLQRQLAAAHADSRRLQAELDSLAEEAGGAIDRQSCKEADTFRAGPRKTGRQSSMSSS
jgi:hypothetical protein